MIGGVDVWISEWPERQNVKKWKPETKDQFKNLIWYNHSIVTGRFIDTNKGKKERYVDLNLRSEDGRLKILIIANHIIRIHLQCRRSRFDSWVWKIPWRRKWQPTPVFLPGKSPWTEKPGGLQSTGHELESKPPPQWYWISEKYIRTSF